MLIYNIRSNYTQSSQIKLWSNIYLYGPDHKTSYLLFRLVRDIIENDWRNHPERLGRVIKSKFSVFIKRHFKTLNIYKWDIEVEQIEEKLKMQIRQH